jgi:hypothetical protein
MIFESANNGGESIINSQDKAIDLIKNIEIPVCLNLGLSYLKTE